MDMKHFYHNIYSFINGFSSKGPETHYLYANIYDYRYYYEKCPEVVSEKKTVYVGIALYLVNLHSVDMKGGTFHADFYLYFKGNYNIVN